MRRDRCPDEATIDSTGHFLYVTDECNPFIYQYSINPKTGALAALPPFTNNAISSTDALVTDSAGFVYATDPGNSGIIEMSIDKTGASCGSLPGCLKFIGTAMDSGANFVNPVGLTIDPTGKFLYAVGSGRTTSSLAMPLPGVQSG